MNLRAPIAPKKTSTFGLHGDVRKDDYFWLREKTDPETMKYLKAENAYYEAYMKPLEPLTKRLFGEMRKRIKEDDSSVPSPYRDFSYYVRFQKGKQYPLQCRRPRRGGREQVLLDGNALAKGKKYFHTTGYEVSPDQNLLAYGTDFDGSERYRVHFKDLSTGKILKDELKDSSGSFAWADDETFFYVVVDANLRPYRVYRHVLGESPKDDVLVYEEKDAKQFISLHHSASEEYLFITSAGKVTSESWYLPVSQPRSAFKCFEPRKEGLEYYPDHREGEFWILTNWKAPDFQVMRTPERKTSRRNWKTFVPHTESKLKTNLILFRDFMVITERERALPKISVYDFTKKKWHAVKFKDPVFSVGVGENLREYESTTLRISYSSPVRPDTVFDYDLRTRKFKTLKTQTVKGHVPSRYKCERVFIESHDGEKVPLTLLYKKGFKRDGKAPGYLYGYGSYGVSIPAAFPGRRDIYRLVDRGFVYALAHPRGGEEMGRRWYLNGKFLKKKNTFKDFIACAQYLVDRKWVAPKRLAICGGSAGGMLMGACMNMRPDLFGAVIAHVPFVDVLNTMLDKDLPLTQMEYKEWGNPEEPRYYKYIKSYSPYDNVTRKAYPPLMVTCGLNDPRVTYWEPAKWVAKLRELKKGDAPIVFKTNMGAGHFGQSGRYQHLEEQAEEYSFILKTFGLTDSEKIRACAIPSRARGR